jgi:hypothetical protein
MYHMGTDRSKVQVSSVVVDSNSYLVVLYKYDYATRVNYTINVAVTREGFWHMLRHF